jgi:hypothetical protein
MEKLLQQKELKKIGWFFSGIKLPNCRKRTVRKLTILLPSAICTGQIYPSQVAPRQSLCPFQFDKTKLSKIFSLSKIKNYFCKLISGLKNDCKFIAGLSINSVNFF